MKLTIRCHFTSPTDAQTVAQRLGIALPEGETVVELEAVKISGPHRTEHAVFGLWQAGPLVLAVGKRLADGTPYAQLLHDGGTKTRQGKRRTATVAQETLF